MKDIIERFRLEYEKSSEQKRKELLLNTNSQLLTQIFHYPGSYNYPELKKEIAELERQRNLDTDSLISFQEMVEKRKREIEDLILNMDLEEVQSLSPEEKKALDLFFNETHETVINNILDELKSRILTPNARNRRRKNSFNIQKPAVTFPDEHHSNEELNYLENLYKEKADELELDKIGIVKVEITQSSNKIRSPIYYIDYSSPEKLNPKKFDWYHYVLTAGCDLEKAKRMIMQKR